MQKNKKTLIFVLMRNLLLSIYWGLTIVLLFFILRFSGTSFAESMYLSSVLFASSIIFKICLAKWRRRFLWRAVYAIIGILICQLLFFVLFYYFKSQIYYPYISLELPPVSAYIIFFIAPLLFGYGNYLLCCLLDKYYKSPTKEITFVSQRQTITLPISDILYIESHDNEVWIYIKDGSHYKNRTPISHWENILGERFVRIQRAYLVSLDAVTSADEESVFIGSNSLHVSPKYRETVRKLLLS